MSRHLLVLRYLFRSGGVRGTHLFEVLPSWRVKLSLLVKRFEGFEPGWVGR